LRDSCQEQTRVNKRVPRLAILGVAEGQPRFGDAHSPTHLRDRIAYESEASSPA
jgi:hypothetical protein